MQSWTIRANVWTIQSNDGFTMPNIKFTLRIHLLMMMISCGGEACEQFEAGGKLWLCSHRFELCRVTYPQIIWQHWYSSPDSS